MWHLRLGRVSSLKVETTSFASALVSYLYTWFMLSRLPRLSIATPRLWSTLATHTAPLQFARSLNTIPNMSSITDDEILARFEKLSLTKPEIINHAPVKNGAEWKAELEKIGKGNVSLTKTVRPLYLAIWSLRNRSDGPS